MNNYLLLIYPILVLSVTFCGCKICSKGDFTDSCWSREQSRFLQGIFCLFVILHHLTQSVTSYGQINKGPITILSSMGILFTSVFFFFSGYGLIYSYMHNEKYLSNFLSHRLPVILVPFFISNIIYTLVRIYCIGIPTRGITLFKCITGLVLLNGNGWYIVEIFLLYLAFFFLFKFVRKKDTALVLLSLFTVCLIIKGLYSGHDYTEIGGHWFKGEWWYNSTITFIMGILFARYREKITDFLKARYRLLLPVTAILFIATFVIEEIVRNVYGYYHESAVIDGINEKFVTLVAQSILCLVFMLLVLLIGLKVTLGNRILKGLALISTELFLIHNLFLHCIFDFTHIKDFYIFAIVLICSIPAAVLFHLTAAPLIRLLQNLSLGRPKDYLKDCETDLFRLKREHNILTLKKILKYGLLVILCLSILWTLFYNLIQVPLSYKKELKQLSFAQPGDIVRLGKYETNYLIPGKEPLTWIVLEKNDADMLLITECGIEPSVYHTSHQATNWQDSYIRNYLNSEIYYDIFNRYEKKMVVITPDTEDALTLLSANEAAMYFENDTARQIKLSPVAEKKGTNVNNMSKVNYWDSKGYRSSWWWLRGDSTASLTAPIVTVDGTISNDEKYINKPYGAVRPVVRIHLP